MPEIVGALAVPVGKLLLKAKLGAEAADVGGSLLQLAFKRLGDRQKAAEAERKARAVGEAVVQDLDRFLRLEGADEGDLAAAVDQLGETIDGHVDAALLVKGRLAPEAIAQAILDARPVDGLFPPGDPAVGYYRQLVTGLAPRLRAVADALPSYTVERDAEFLAKLDTLDRTAPEILAGVREIGERQREEETRRRRETETHEELYLHSLAAKVREVRLFGVDLDRDTPSSLPLSIAYIPLRLRLGPDEEARGQPLEYAELLALLPLLGNRLLIEGAAGSGKTTVLQWTALEALLVQVGESPAPPGLSAVVDRHHDVIEAIGQPQHGLPDELLRSVPRLARGRSARTPGLQEDAAEFLGEGGRPAGKLRLDADPWHARTPFFVRLRLCPDGQLPEPEGLPALIAHGSGSAVEPWVRRRLLDGRALVLLDGIDEVPDAKRRDIRESIANYFGHYRDAQFVVTSRPAAVKDPAWGELFGSCRAGVQGMAPVDIESFVEQWYEALAATVRGAFDRAAVDRITGEILASAALRQLAETPLLCAAICYLHRVRRGELPRRLNGLYEKLCELLIHRRDREQFEREGQERLNRALRGLDLDDRQALLAGLAHFMVREEVAALDVVRAEEQVRAGLAGLRKLDGREPSEVLDALQERSGVLRGASPTSVEFAHNGLRSYLAASVYRGEVSYGDVVSKALATDDPDLSVLAAAQGGEPYRDGLVGELLSRASRAETNRGQRRVLLIMAARCGNTGPVPAATAERLAAVGTSSNDACRGRTARGTARTRDPRLTAQAEEPGKRRGRLRPLPAAHRGLRGR